MYKIILIIAEIDTKKMYESSVKIPCFFIQKKNIKETKIKPTLNFITNWIYGSIPSIL